ncbi:MAG: serine/threonine-protein phosphatase [Isosphaeraceae bacterium]|nr:serine/threonine-protein phosphatase [Isosphaeraceae bacterium]
MPSDLHFDQAEDTTDEFQAPSRRPPQVRVEAAGRTHPGKVRENNEDHFLIARLCKALRVHASSLPEDDLDHFAAEEGYLYVVADGMGGAAAGERASAVAIQTVDAFVLNTVKWFLHLGQHEENALLAELRRCLERADRAVFERAAAEPGLVGMGTTLTLAYSVGDDLFVVHAGDSRAYLLREHTLHRLTSDHTLAQMMVDGGLLSPEAARHDRRRNIVVNVVGGPRPGVQAEIHKVVLADGDTLLLCTDGLSEPVTEERITSVLARAESPDAACRRLVDLALDAGGPDNVTAIVARYQID